MSNHEFHLTAFAAHRMNRLRIKKSTLEAHILYKGQSLPVPVPTGKLRMTVKSTVSPAQPQPQINNKIPLQTLINNNLWKSKAIKDGGTLTIRTPKGLFILCPKNQTVIKQPPPVTTVHMQVEPPAKKIHVDLPSKPEQPKMEPQEPEQVTNGTNEKPVNRKKPGNREEPVVPAKGIFSSALFSKTVSPLKSIIKPKKKVEPPRIVNDRLVQNLLDKVSCLHSVNERRCNACPLYGKDLVESVSIVKPLTNLAKRLPILGNDLSNFMKKI